MADGLSDEIKAFIADHIRSVEQLEILLLLQRNPGREWSAADVSRELYVSPESTATRLTDFHARGFLTLRQSPEPLYRYQPKGSLDRLARDLATEYELRRVRVINQIFSNPVDQVRTFADAFKFKKKDEE